MEPNRKTKYSLQAILNLVAVDTNADGIPDALALVNPDGTKILAGGLEYQGLWNANTNTPALASGVGTNGYYYAVSVAGTTNLDGITDWEVNDWAIFNGTTWQKLDNSEVLHNEKPDLQGGIANEYYHFTAAQHTLLTGNNQTEADFIVSTEAELTSVLASIDDNQSIYIKRKENGANYSFAAGLDLPDKDGITLFGNGAILERPDTDHLFKQGNYNLANWNIQGLKFNGSGKTGNYSFIKGYTGRRFDNFNLINNVFDVNSFHAFHAGIWKGLVAFNRFREIDGYCIHGGFLGSTYYQGNLCHNSGAVGLVNAHGLLWCNDGTFFWVEGNYFEDQTTKVDYVVYWTESGTAFTGKISDNYFFVGNTVNNNMIELVSSASYTQVYVMNNQGFGCGVGKECNLSTFIDSTKFIIVEHNYSTDKTW